MDVRIVDTSRCTCAECKAERMPAMTRDDWRQRVVIPQVPRPKDEDGPGLGWQIALVFAGLGLGATKAPAALGALAARLVTRLVPVVSVLVALALISIYVPGGGLAVVTVLSGGLAAFLLVAFFVVGLVVVRHLSRTAPQVDAEDKEWVVKDSVG